MKVAKQKVQVMLVIHSYTTSNKSLEKIYNIIVLKCKMFEL